MKPKESQVWDMVDQGEVRVVPLNQPVGGYWMGGPMSIGFMLHQRPSWWHRKMVRLFLGWEWRDQ